jgi:tRNA pseudouridine55 synthase
MSAHRDDVQNDVQNNAQPDVIPVSPCEQWRDVDGLLVVDKPRGQSSNAVLQYARRLFGAKKGGHTGSLDPLATGVLPLCFGEATKFSQYLLEADKAYMVTALLGVNTDTGDAGGEVVDTGSTEHVTQTLLNTVIAKFLGKTEQLPPVLSAVKFRGRPLYKWARRGVEVDRIPRVIEIYAIDLLKWQGSSLTLHVRCSKGTYIRSLVEDLGQALGCGAHVIALRRTQAGPFALRQAISLTTLEQIYEKAGVSGLDRILLPTASAVSHWPEISIPNADANFLLQGQLLDLNHLPDKNSFCVPGWVRIAKYDQAFIGIGEVLEDGRLAPRRMIATGT